MWCCAHGTGYQRPATDQSADPRRADSEPYSAGDGRADGDSDRAAHAAPTNPGTDGGTHGCPKRDATADRDSDYGTDDHCATDTSTAADCSANAGSGACERRPSERDAHRRDLSGRHALIGHRTRCLLASRRR